MVKSSKRPGQKTEKDPPIFSQEYLLQNQADLISSLCLVIMSGLLFKATRALSAKFCMVQHNTTNLTDPDEKAMYAVGRADICMSLFYSLLFIAIHAVENEYFWEKIGRRLHLSKTRMSEFMDQGSTMPFHIAIVAGAIYVFVQEDMVYNLTSIWEHTPADSMPMLIKFYWILIIAFVLHQYPEMYFMRVKNEDMPDKIIGYTAYLIPILGAYLTGLVYPATIILVIHCGTEVLKALSDVVGCSGNEDMAQPLYRIWSVAFILARNAIAAISVVTFFKLRGKTPDEISQLRFIACTLVLLILLGLQLYLGWKFVQTVLSWRHQAKEVALAQKKADNFWQQRKEANKEAKKARAEKRAAKAAEEKAD
ncbi:hypothetical protein ACHWQZ_G018490 [Mnemiopsis leidyi]